MRLSHAVGAVALLATIGWASDKPADTLPKSAKFNPEKLIGTWKVTHLDGKPWKEIDWVETYTSDGKFTRIIDNNRPEQKHMVGTYKINGNVLHIELVVGASATERVSDLPIHVLTADTLVCGGSRVDGGSRLTFKRQANESAK